MPTAAVHISAMTHVGLVRSRNEDAFATSATDEFPLICWNGTLPAQRCWVLVADGIGGHVAGEVASRLAIELLRPVLGSLTSRAEVIGAVNAANTALFDTMEGQPALEGMGTTIAGAILHNKRALAFNLGDSRIYHYHQGVLTQISEDDVVGGNMLTQCLGGGGIRTSLDVHFQDIRLAPAAKLLLCSDGLTDLIPDDDIAAILGASNADHASLLVQAALDAGGIDNVSAVVITIGNAD
jgi:serine/threonine protein phosphatase PrpC